MQDATFSYLLFVASRLLEKEKEKKREQHPRFTVSFIDDEYKTQWWLYISIGIRDLILGLSIGIFLGICFIFFPHRSHRYVDRYRVTCLVLGSLMCTTGIAKIAISGAGFLSTLTLAFISITGWKILSHKFDSANLRRIIHTLWKLAQPILVGIIGADIDLTLWTISRFGLHLFCILFGLMGRCITAYIVAWSISSFTWKERLFLITASIPKGTLQAALGPLAYEQLRHNEGNEEFEMALNIIMLSIITFFLAPIGYSLMNYTGPIFLEQITEEQRQKERELSYLRILSLLPESPNNQINNQE